MSRPTAETRPDLYARVTDALLADLERGVRPWTRPWSAEHLAGRISRPLRHNFQPYSGINVLLLWAEACAKSFSAPIWMTFRQALELGGHVRKGEHGSTVVIVMISRQERASDWAVPRNPGSWPPGPAQDWLFRRRVPIWPP